MADFDPIASLLTSHRCFNTVLALPCKAHAVRPGVPCWTIEDECGVVNAAVCGRRIRSRGFGQ